MVPRHSWWAEDTKAHALYEQNRGEEATVNSKTHFAKAVRGPNALRSESSVPSTLPLIDGVP